MLGTFARKALEGTDMLFSKFHIPANEIFLKSNSSYALVNLKPFTPGHVLVIPDRIVPNLRDLTEAEMKDLMELADATIDVVKEVFKFEKVCTAVQDGPIAGQTVPHVHVHILPKIEVDPSLPRVPRTPEQKAEEAALLNQVAQKLAAARE